jgi:hypothetical protein
MVARSDGLLHPQRFVRIRFECVVEPSRPSVVQERLDRAALPQLLHAI